jgi:16S rRNA (guanine527-N7)-methyltransferase
MSNLQTELTWLIEGAQSFSIHLSDEQLSQFSIYKKLLLEWNSRINLTAITDDKDIQIRHFLDSLSCSLATGDLNGAALVDAGTGAGFPGAPLKILYPNMKLTLVDSVSKKAAFLRALVTELGLSGVEIIDERLEDMGQEPRYRESFDWAVSRGVAKFAVLVEYLLPLCRVGGHALAQKGEGEIQALDDSSQVIARLGGSAAEITPVKLPERSQIHYLVTIPKVAPTPPKFPRRPGVPSKHPLA